ncbi:MAG: hypothetical protein JO072_09115 [Parafilimonas sp.]|nr:hypothetical protein [Parafilimonas sp.]
MSQKTKTTLDSLQGYWQSEDDRKNVIQISGYNEINFYDKEQIDSVSFVLADSCKDVILSGDSLIKNGNFYITLDKDGSLCYSIDSLTDDHLTLMYQARGNLLRFKRIKKVK